MSGCDRRSVAAEWLTRVAAGGRGQSPARFLGFNQADATEHQADGTAERACYGWRRLGVRRRVVARSAGARSLAEREATRRAKPGHRETTGWRKETAGWRKETLGTGRSVVGSLDELADGLQLGIATGPPGCLALDAARRGIGLPNKALVPDHFSRLKTVRRYSEPGFDSKTVGLPLPAGA